MQEDDYDWSTNRFVPPIKSLVVLIVAVIVGLANAGADPNSGGMFMLLLSGLIMQLGFWWTVWNLLVLAAKLLNNP